MKIKYRLLAVLIPTILFITGASIFAVLKISEHFVVSQINNEAFSLARSYSKEFYAIFETSKKIAEGISASLTIAEEIAIVVKANNDVRGKYVRGFLLKTVASNPDIYGCAAAYDPEKYYIKNFAPYYYWKNGEMKYTSLGDPEYQYHKWDWFKDPMRTAKGSWSEPYFDKGGGNALMVTYSSPIIFQNAPVGVATCDLTLDTLVKRVKSLRVGENSYAFIISKNGYFIAHPDAEMLSKETIWKMAENSKDPDMIKFTEFLKSASADVLEANDPFRKKPSLIITSLIKSTDWLLVLIFPKSEILAPLENLRHNVVMIAGTIIVLLVLIILWLSSTVSSPIVRLVSQTEKYASGEFGEKLEEDSGPQEIRDLSKAFNTMGQAITNQINNLRATFEQKEVYRQELMIAAQIQQSVLPQSSQPFPELSQQVFLHGFSEPAKEVGGDYYDYFQLSDQRLGLVIADVSGKGVPSAIFTAMTQKLILEIAERGHSPAEIIRRANGILSRDNKSCMFVTLLYGEYDVGTGVIRFVNAGHPAPLLISSAGEVSQIKLKKSIALGVMPGARYEVTEFTLAPGETLIFFTDGVTEAMDCDGNEYGINRFINNVKANTDISCRELPGAILKSIKSFCGDAPVSDDVTMLILRRLKTIKGNVERPAMKESEAIRMRLPADAGVIDALKNAAELMAKRIGFDDKEVYEIILSLDEIVTNVIMHAYEGMPNEFYEVDLIPLEKGIRVDVSDHGRSFDFDKISTRYRGKATIDQPVGGIGLYLVRKSVDDVWYETGTIEGNRLSFVKYVKGPASASK